MSAVHAWCSMCDCWTDHDTSKHLGESDEPIPDLLAALEESIAAARGKSPYTEEKQ